MIEIESRVQFENEEEKRMWYLLASRDKENWKKILEGDSKESVEEEYQACISEICNEEWQYIIIGEDEI